jgi:hypothetical protein
MRWQFNRVRELYPQRGLGLTYSRGTTGTTYGDPRQNVFLTVSAVVLLWTFNLHFSWKR